MKRRFYALLVRLFERPMWPASWFAWAFNKCEDSHA